MRIPAAMWPTEHTEEEAWPTEEMVELIMPHLGAVAAVSRQWHAAFRRVVLRRWLAPEALRRLVPSTLDDDAHDDDASSDDAPRSTLLHLAAAKGMVDAVKLLLESGAPLDFVDSRGATPLDEAERGEHAAVIALLAKHTREWGLAQEAGPKACA
jgi:hypothetical protein